MSTQALLNVSLNFFANINIFIVCGLNSDSPLRNFDHFLGCKDATITNDPATDAVQLLFPGFPGSAHAKSSVKWFVTYEGSADYESSSEGSSAEDGSGMPIVDLN
jgi:hypothetical protein